MELVTPILILSQFTLGLMGIYLSVYPQQNNKPRLWITAFCIVMVLSLTAGFFQQQQSKADNTKQEKRLTDALSEQKKISNKLQVDLFQSHLSQEFMKGQLSSISSIMGKISQSVSDPGIKQMASAISKLASPSSQTTILTDKQLCTKAMDLAKRMHEFEYKRRVVEDATRNRWWPNLRLAKTEQEKNEIWQKGTAQDTNVRMQLDHEFRATLLGEAVYLRDELLKRLPTQPKPEMRLIAFEGALAGVSPVSDAAAYLENLSRKLCPE